MGRRPLLYRNRSDRVVSGVASGIALRLGVEPVMVRAAFWLLALVFGLGVFLYLGFIAMSTPAFAADIPSRDRSGRNDAGLILMVVGVLTAADAATSQGPLRAALTFGAVVAGVVLLWTRSAPLFGARRVFGAGLLLCGFVGAPSSLSVHDNVSTPLLFGASLFGLFLIAGGPVVVRLVDQLQVERRARIRSEERTELSAQLHDSVLQTLTLIQRSASVEHIHALARTQERELRDWMLGREQADSEDLGNVLRRRATEIEKHHDVRVDVVTVGKATMTGRVSLLVDAMTEAMSNAARHSRAEKVSVFLEVEPAVITGHVSDEGAGFDIDTVHPERRGVRESMVGRMERAGGSATIISSPKTGTEIVFRLPLEQVHD